MEFIDANETLLFRDGRGKRDFVGVHDVSIQDLQPKGYRVSFNPNKVDYIEEV